MTRALLVYHGASGNGDHDREELVMALAAKNISATTCMVDPPQIRAALCSADLDLIIAAGGDGTAALVIALVAERQQTGLVTPPIAILPIGGLNNIACTFGVEGEAADIIARWRDGHHVMIDVGVAHGPWGRGCFVESAGFGALSVGLSSVEVSPREAEQKQAVGRAAFRSSLAEAVPMDVVLWLDGERLACRLLMLEVLNIPRIGPRLTFAPKADPADGQLDVLMVRPKDRDAMLAWLDADCEDPCPVQTRAARQVRVDGDFPQCRLDDPKREQPTKGTTITLSTMQNPVALMLPAKRPSNGEHA